MLYLSIMSGNLCCLHVKRMESGDQGDAQIISNWFEGSSLDKVGAEPKKDSYNKVVGGMRLLLTFK